MSLSLYSTALCPFAHRARLVLAEKRLPCTLVTIDLRDKPAAFLAASPHGKVPVLRHDGRSVWESAVIAEYLEDAFPAVAMLPGDPFERAKARMWIRFADDRLYAATSRLLHSTDPQLHARSLAEIEADLLFIEEHAFADRREGDRYWMGAAFTLVDATFHPWFEQFEVLQAFFGLRWPQQCMRLSRWREAVAMRPSVAAIAEPASFYLERYGALRRA